MDIKLSAELGELLRAKGKWLAVAESCTGGLLGGVITEIPGSSDYFLGGVISYADKVKRDLLGVPSPILEKYGAVSPQTVTSMVEGVCRLLGAECGIAVSGIAGPGGGTWEKPAGLVYIGIRYGNRTRTIENKFNGTRLQIREQTCYKSLEALIEILRQA